MNGFGTALRLAARRNWAFWLIWILVLASLLPATIAQYDSLIGTGAEAEAALTVLSGDPTMRAILGPPFDLTTPFGFAAWRVGAFTAIGAAFVAGLGIIRATRAEEEAGRVELLRSGALGRHVPLAAGVALGLAASTVLALAVTGGLLASDAPVAGAVAMGSAIGLGGWMWTGVGAAVAQCFEGARAAKGWALGIALGGAFLLRAAVDASGSDSPTARVLTWLNPLAWPAQVRSFAGERWWVLLLPVAFTALTVAVAFRLEAVRDHGAGLFAARNGRATASPALSGAWGLALRLHRTSLLGWLAGMVVGAFTIGALGSRMSEFIEGNEGFQQVLARMGRGAADVTEGFYVAMVGLLIAILAIGAIGWLGRLRSEEATGHAETLLATAIPRTRLAASHLTVAAVATVAGSTLTAALTAIPGAAQSGNWGEIWRMALGGLILSVGSLLIVGLGMVLIGWLPPVWPVLWAVIGWSIFVAWFGPVLGLPQWLLDLQPWGHLPHYPSEAMHWGPVLIEAATAVILAVVGLIGYRRRDIQS